MTIGTYDEVIAAPGRSEAQPAEFVTLAQLWTLLTRGEYVLVGSLYSEQRCFVRLQKKSLSTPDPRLASTRIRLLERFLLGESQKVVAFDMGVAVSTVALSCRDLLVAMGEGRPTSRACVLLTMAAHASRGFPLGGVRLTAGEESSAPCWSLSVERPDVRLPDSLSPTEQAVVRLVVEGRSHLEIARHRRVSPRTIANQLASVYRKLKLSGRGELLAYLVRLHCHVAKGPRVS